MANQQRGEIEATFSGQSYTLCLTLGAIAELEAAFDTEDFIAVIERLQKGKIKADDIITILTAGLKGGGNEVSRQEVATMKIEGGLKGAVVIVADLLSATFQI